MSFTDAIKTCFQKYAVFAGRAPRSEYWWFVLFGALLSLPAAFIDELAAPGMSRGPVSTIISLALLLPQLAVTVRRLHDVDRSGWWLGGIYLYLLVAAIVAVAIFAGKPSSGLDAGQTASLIGLGAIGVIYLIWLFVLSVLRGTDGPNDYGPDPLGPDVSVF